MCNICRFANIIPAIIFKVKRSKLKRKHRRKWYFGVTTPANEVMNEIYIFIHNFICGLFKFSKF